MQFAARDSSSGYSIRQSHDIEGFCNARNACVESRTIGTRRYLSTNYKYRTVALAARSSEFPRTSNNVYNIFQLTANSGNCTAAFCHSDRAIVSGTYGSLVFTFVKLKFGSREWRIETDRMRDFGGKNDRSEGIRTNSRTNSPTDSRTMPLEHERTALTDDLICSYLLIGLKRSIFNRAFYYTWLFHSLIYHFISAQPAHRRSISRVDRASGI